MSEILIAFRTHIWDEVSKKLAYKLYLETSEFDFVVLLDESKEQINVSPLQKVSHTSDMNELGLPHIPSHRNNLHYNGDYALFALRKQKPNYKFYAMLEGDMSINIDLVKILQQCVDDKVDFIGNFTKVDEEAINRILQTFPVTGKVFFPFIAASNQLIDALYHKRLDLKQQYNHKQFWWPYCEFFIGSYLASNPEFKTLALQDIADLTNFTWKDHKHIYDPRVYKKGTIVHPITSSSQFIEKNLMSNNIENIFNEQSTLFTGVQLEEPHIFLPVLEKKIKEKKNLDLLIKFWNFALLKGWIKLPHPINIAFCKPATQSSICSASRFQNKEEDAALLVDGILEHSSRSHTDYEEKPWIMIDLIDYYEIRTFFIYVRPDCSSAFCDFRIDLSNNGNEWSTIYQKIDGISSDSTNMKPIIINVDTGHKGRFVKITQENAGWLHLNQIEIYPY